MCTTISILAYMILTAGATILLAFAALTPELWTLHHLGFGEAVKQQFQHLGGCKGGRQGVEDCIPSWTADNAKVWEKATGCLLVTATTLSAIAFVWAVVAFIGCCCRSCLTEPLPSIAVIAFLNSLVPPILVAVYKSEDKAIGYSMIGAAVATVVLFLALLFGLLTVKTRKPDTAMIMVRSRRWETAGRSYTSKV